MVCYDMSNVVSLFTGQDLKPDYDFVEEQRLSRLVIEVLLDQGYDIVDYIEDNYT